MPLNQPGGDIIIVILIILEPGCLVLVVYCPSVFTCTCVLNVGVCVCACVGACVWQPARVPLATSSECESAAACSNMHPELPAPLHFLVSFAHTHRVQVSRREEGNATTRTVHSNVVSHSEALVILLGLKDARSDST